MSLLQTVAFEVSGRLAFRVIQTEGIRVSANRDWAYTRLSTSGCFLVRYEFSETGSKKTAPRGCAGTPTYRLFHSPSW